MQCKVDFSQIEIRKLKGCELVSGFDCGDEDLNDFIQNEASLYRQSLLAVSYVLVEKNAPEKPLAFCSVANDKVALGDFANSTEFNRFRKKQGFPQSKRLKSYPAVKLCRLGVSNEFKGENLGTFILDFVKMFFTQDNKSGCRFLTVDAYIAAIPFYEKNGFKKLGSKNEGDPRTCLLFYDLNEIAA